MGTRVVGRNGGGVSVRDRTVTQLLCTSSASLEAAGEHAKSRPVMLRNVTETGEGPALHPGELAA
ncbi:hypothetical protein B7R54_12295 [Subtercola boreus]|uniref:Uncharacterized protein n=1 Tax=Subtercola boreus TaxID=120213 RepID=A0A3E0VJT5_9MICO|nr:hypothetical protein B7R54_12295 [Subtercola boreus]TQL52971.1 hypothetical protein FB464_0462 [Subtercola boreus]